MGFTWKLRNEVVVWCSNVGCWTGFEYSAWRSGETLGLVIFAFIIFIVAIVQAKLVEWEIL